MTDALILHHYEASPFSEKIRRILAYKQQPWTAVRAPAVMPKADLLALTGGYRKIPVLQIGNHVYCDTALIALELERRKPSPTLYPTPIVESLAEWADTVLFESLVPHILRPTRFDDLLRWLSQDELARIVDDRRELRKDAVQPGVSGAVLRARFQHYLSRIEGSLGNGKYLLGDVPCIADFSVYHGVWLLSRTGPEVLAGRPNLSAFIERIGGFADPEITPLSSEEALAICRRAPQVWQPSAAQWSDPLKLEAGQPVTVRAGDYGRDPVQGVLVWLGAIEVVLRREDERAGVVYVHFPRVGYEITAG
jgi:glutathione S-transferase